MLGSCSLEDMMNVSNTLGNGSQEDGSQGNGSQEDGSQEDGSQEDGSQEDGSQEDGSQEDGSQEDGSQEDGSQEDGSQEDGSQEDGSQEDGSQEDGSQEDGSQEDGSQEDGSQEDGSQEDGSQEDGSQEGSHEDGSQEDGSQEDASQEDGSQEDGSQEGSSRVPKLVINELCTGYDNPKTEFIELRMKTAGNLGAIRIVINGNSNVSKEKIYEFLPLEVEENDFVVLHLRTLEASCINEYNGDIEESNSENSSSLAWDFFVSGNTKFIQEEATAVYVLDQDDNVLDAVMISAVPNLSWSKNYFAETAAFLFEKGAWISADGQVCRPADSVISIDATATRTICRDETAEDTNTAADWYITATSNATPGKANSAKRFIN